MVQLFLHRHLRLVLSAFDSDDIQLSFRSSTAASAFGIEQSQLLHRKHLALAEQDGLAPRDDGYWPLTPLGEAAADRLPPIEDAAQASKGRRRAPTGRC